MSRHSGPDTRSFGGPCDRCERSPGVVGHATDDRGALHAAYEATRQLLQARNSDTAQEIRFQLCRDLGGHVVPADSEDPTALPINLALLDTEPVLPAPEHMPATCRGRSPARTGPALRPCATSWAVGTRRRMLRCSCGESVANRLRMTHQRVRGVHRRRSSSHDSGAGRNNQKSHLPPPQVCRDLCWIDLLLARSSPFWGSLGASISWENSGARNSAPGSQVHSLSLDHGLRHC